MLAHQRSWRNARGLTGRDAAIPKSLKETRLPAPARLERIARLLENSVFGVAAAAVVFSLSWFWHLPKAAGAHYGTGDVVDFGLTFLLLMLSTACAACGVATSLRGGSQASAAAYRPLLIGVTTFAAYYFVAPHLPQLF
jgi:hypothetical protein